MKLIKDLTISFMLLSSILYSSSKMQQVKSKDSTSSSISLPSARLNSKVSVERALSRRRSVRQYQNTPLKLSDLSQLLWAAQGITNKRYGLRTAPSAGALYPLELYILVGHVENLAQGIYKYLIHEHKLARLSKGDQRVKLYQYSLNQGPIKNAPLVLLFTAIYDRTSKKYGERAGRYVHMEVGSALQNVYLQAETLGLGTVMIGAFNDYKIKQLLKLAENEYPLAIMPIGKK